MANSTNNWKYSDAITKNHKIVSTYNCIENIDKLCLTEGARQTPFKNEVCLNLDAYERKTNTNELDCTMDFAFGVVDKINTKTEGMILVELKLNCSTGNSLNAKNLNNKIKHSGQILGNNPPIQKPYYFIFNKKHLSECKNRLVRCFNGNIQKAIATDINNLHSIFF